MSRRRSSNARVLPRAVAADKMRGRSDLCHHGMVLYASPAAARTAAKRIRKDDPTSQHLRPWPCPDVDGHYHLGTLDPAVVAGTVDADTFYATNLKECGHVRDR